MNQFNLVRKECVKNPRDCSSKKKRKKKRNPEINWQKKTRSDDVSLITKIENPIKIPNVTWNQRGAEKRRNLIQNLFRFDNAKEGVEERYLSRKILLSIVVNKKRHMLMPVVSYLTMSNAWPMFLTLMTLICTRGPY